MKIMPKVRKYYSKTYRMPLFTGYVEVWHNKKYQWAESCKGGKRLTHDDAFLDACELAADIQLQNRTGEHDEKSN